MNGVEVLADQLFFSKEAAEFLGITVQRLNKLVKEGKIKPLKKNASGTIFHIDELERRKKELKIFSEVERKVGSGMFVFDTGTKCEALNFATLMNVLCMTEHKLEPLFDSFGKTHQLDIPMDMENMAEEYAEFFLVDRKVLLKEYEKAKMAFFTLRETDEIIKRGSRDYPPLLAKTEQAPRFLYIRGKKSLLYETRTVALVGSRQASENSKENTIRLARSLGQNGITVVSGLAKGIDVNAHLAALKSNYNTIAVIGTNLNQYYPSENRWVQQQIEEKGLVVSQFSPANMTERWFFPLRNGTMSGLSLATVIMEAGETSGALKQADFALKQGRKVLIPESALKMETISWPAKYVERGALPVKTPMDVLRILAESNIFQADLEAEQLTLDDFWNSQPEQEDATTWNSWSESITIEG